MRLKRKGCRPANVKPCECSGPSGERGDSPVGVSRKTFLKIMGGGALAAAVAAAASWPVLVGNTEAQSNPPQTYRRLRRWSMVIDLRSCDGCQSVGLPPQCTISCIQGHFVPEPQQWIEVFEFPLERGGTRFVPTPCMQCANAPCVSVCPVGATWTTPEGVVLIDQGRCIGCRICMAACPYDRRFFNWGKPPIPPEAMFMEYGVEHQVPGQMGTVVKCDFCPEVARAGRLPYCVIGCPHRAIYYGDLEEDLATNGREVVKISQFVAENDGYRLKEELRTQPRVYYIAGHGQNVGRSPFNEGRKPMEWPWVETVKGAKVWTR